MEFAVIFNKKELVSDGSIYYEPIKIVKGNYDDEFELFRDIDGVEYPHMLDFYVDANLYYGNRIRLSKSNRNKDYLNRILVDLKRYKYKLDINIDLGRYYILKIDKNNQNNMLAYNDVETDVNGFYLTDYYYEDYADEQFDGNIISLPEVSELKDNKEEKNIQIDPNKLFNDITKIVKGQDEQIKAIVSKIYYHYNFPNLKKQNLLIAGKTGVGKTRIFEEIAKSLDVPIVIIDITGYTESGYVGKDVNTILEDLIVASNYDVNRANRSIVVIDEIDKLKARNGSDYGVNSVGVQQALLKLVEGKEEIVDVNHVNYKVDTHGILFVGLGSFMAIGKEEKKRMGFNNELREVKNNSLTKNEMLAKNVFTPELLGRFETFIVLNDLDKEKYLDIIYNSEESPLKSYIDMLNSLNINLSISDDAINKVVDKTLELNLGVRGLFSMFLEPINKALEDICLSNEKYDYLDVYIVNDEIKYELGKNKCKQLKMLKEPL